MAAKGENVGSIYVDVGADIGNFNTALSSVERRLKALVGGSYIAKLQTEDATKRGNAQRPTVEVQAKFAQNYVTVLERQLKSAKLAAPVSLTLTSTALSTLKSSILTGMAGFVVPVKVQMTGVAQGGQQIVVDGESGTVVTPARAATTRARSTGRTQTRSRAATAAAAVPDTGAAERAQEIAALQAERASLEDALKAYGEEQYQKRVAANRRPREGGRFISRDQYLGQLSQRIERRAVRELLPRELERRGVTGEELALAPKAEPAAILSARFDQGNVGNITDITRLGDQESLTARALFGMGQGRRPPPSRRLGVRGGLMEPLTDRPLHGPGQLSFPTAIGSEAPRSRVTPGVPGPYEGERTIRPEYYGRATGAYGAPYATGAPANRGVQATRSRLGKPMAYGEANLDISEELAQKLQDREMRGRVKAATDKLYAEIERRETTSREPRDAMPPGGIGPWRTKDTPPLTERAMLNRLVGSGRGRTATGLTRDEARQFLPQTTRTEAAAAVEPTNINDRRLSIEETMAYNQKAAEPRAEIARGGGGPPRRTGLGLVGTGGGGGGGAGVVDVRVTNWPRGLASRVSEGKASLAGTPEEIAKALDISKEDLTKIFLGEMALPKGPDTSSAVGNQGGRIQMLRDPGVAARKIVPAEPRGLSLQRSRELLRQERESRGESPPPGPTRTFTSEKGIDTLEERAAQLGVKLPRRRSEDAVESALSRSDIAAQRATLPERAPSTAFAQIFARATGVKGRFEAALETERKALAGRNEAAEDLQESRAQSAALREQFDITRDIRQQKQVAGESGAEELGRERQLGGLLRESNKNEKVRTGELEKQTKSLKDATAAREKAGGGAASGAQLAALFVGAKAFLVVNQAFDAAMGAASAAISPVVDQMFGFAETSKRVTAALRDQTVASKGNVDASIAAAGAQAGLSAATVDFLKSSGLSGRVTGQAAGVAGAGARDLFRSTAGLGGGFDESLFTGTGGVLNSRILAEQLGGQPGVLESLSKTLGPLRQQTQAPGVMNPGYEMTLRNYEAFHPEAGAANEEDRQKAAQAFTAAVDDANDALDRAGVSAGKAGKQFEVVAYNAETASKTQMEAMQAFKDSAERIGPEAVGAAEEAIRAGYILQQAGGGALEGRQFGEAAQQLARGRIIQDPSLLVEEQRRSFNASLQASDLRRELQTGTLIPGQLGLQLAGHPQLTPGAGVIPAGTSPEALGLKGSELRALEKSLTKTGELQAQLQARGDRGLEALRVLIGQSDDLRRATYEVPRSETTGTAGKTTRGPSVLPPTPAPGFAPQLPEFNSLVSQLQKYGKELQGIQQGLADKQARNAILDYNQAITITVRNLNDAKLLAGQRGDIDKNTIGHLERQNVLLARQSQELSIQTQELQIQQEQRRINFQVAIAGFQAPGLTSEEREARIQQAKKEAQFAQQLLDIQKKQLGLGKKQFAIGIDIQDRTFRRTVQELEFQLSSLERGRKLVIDTAEANQRIQVLEALIAQTQADISAIVDQASGVAEKVIAIGEAIAAAAGGAVRAVVNATVKQLTRGINQYETLARQIVRVANQIGRAGATISGSGGDDRGAGSSGTYSLSGGQGNAAGALFNTSGAQSMIVGEAGTETVAVLRNPRTVSASVSGSSGAQVVINFNGPMNVRSDDDVKAVAREVEKMMNSRGSLIGLRNLTGGR